jgi:hypothetical protein
MNVEEVLGICLFAVGMLGVMALLVTWLTRKISRKRVDTKIAAVFVQGIADTLETHSYFGVRYHLRVQYAYAGTRYDVLTRDTVRKRQYPESSEVTVWIFSQDPEVCFYYK